MGMDDVSGDRGPAGAVAALEELDIGGVEVEIGSVEGGHSAARSSARTRSEAFSLAVRSLCISLSN